MAKKILSVSDNDALRITRHMMLANRGFEVVSVANLRELRTALKSGDFDLVILGVSIDGPGKREMAGSVRRLCEAAQILELCRISPEVPDAEHHLISPEPAEIDHTVGQILRWDKAGN
jgi:CheY-like chemotaxis protein